MKLIIPLTAAIALAPTAAYAYIEPGSALMVSQILIGAIIGGLVSLKLYWQRIKTRFLSPRAETEQTEPKADSSNKGED